MKIRVVITATEIFQLGPFGNMRKLLEEKGVRYALMTPDLRMPRVSDLEPPWRVTREANGDLIIEQGFEEDDAY